MCLRRGRGEGGWRRREEGDAATQG